MKGKNWPWLDPIISGVVAGLIMSAVHYLLYQEMLISVADKIGIVLLSASLWLFFIADRRDHYAITKSLLCGGTTTLAIYLFPLLARMF